MIDNNQNKITLIEDLGRLYPTETSKEKKRYGLFKCYCGTEFKAQATSIKSGRTKSCGCLGIIKITERSMTHGLTNHRLYKTWKNMMNRCYNSEILNYKDYGGRGIDVCKEWHDVANFINDVSSSFIEGLTLDRIDNNKGYSKDNYRWAKKSTQNRNTRILKSNNTSGFRGVCWRKDSCKFIAQITVDSKRIGLGYFKTAIEAAKAYDKYIIDNKLEHTKNGSLK